MTKNSTGVDLQTKYINNEEKLIVVAVADCILFSECCVYLRICIKYSQEMRGK